LLGFGASANTCIGAKVFGRLCKMMSRFFSGAGSWRMSPRHAKPHAWPPLAEAALLTATAVVAAAVPSAATNAAAARADLLFMRFLPIALGTPPRRGMPDPAARAGNGGRPGGVRAAADGTGGISVYELPAAPRQPWNVRSYPKVQHGVPIKLAADNAAKTIYDSPSAVEQRDHRGQADGMAQHQGLKSSGL